MKITLKMKIAFDFVGTNLGSGTKTYIINFCNQLNHYSQKDDIIIFLCKNYLLELNRDLKNNSKIKYIVKPNFFAVTFIRLIWMQLVLPFELKLRGVKKIYSPMNICPFFCKYFKIKIILALHSNLPWVFFDFMPGSFYRNFLTKKLMELSIHACEILIVDSVFAKEEISNILKINKNKIKVVYLGVDIKFLNQNKSDNYVSGIDYNTKYILSVLSCTRYHNILNLLKAYKVLIKEINFKIKFIIVLQILDKKYFTELSNYIDQNFDKKNIIILNNIDSKYLPNLYRNSKLYVFSSYCEVFGLTSLESMSQGCPVVISKSSALPEVNNNAADYFNPDDIIDIKNKLKINLLDNNKRQNLVKNGKLHYKKFTWEKNVSETMHIIHNLN